MMSLLHFSNSHPYRVNTWHYVAAIASGVRGPLRIQPAESAPSVNKFFPTLMRMRVIVVVLNVTSVKFLPTPGTTRGTVDATMPVAKRIVVIKTQKNKNKKSVGVHMSAPLPTSSWIGHCAALTVSCRGALAHKLTLCHSLHQPTHREPSAPVDQEDDQQGPVGHPLCMDMDMGARLLFGEKLRNSFDSNYAWPYQTY